ncbi:MAG TPA: hypothetical protein VNE71_00715, partial [Myxococcota bacterium]|nr:hypothetical protein [Myxococcota bacterium]
MTRSPAGTVCAGFASDGMPVGLQLIGPQHADVVVLRGLSLLEAALDLEATAPAAVRRQQEFVREALNRLVGPSRPRRRPSR